MDKHIFTSLVRRYLVSGALAGATLAGTVGYSAIASADEGVVIVAPRPVVEVVAARPIVEVMRPRPIIEVVQPRPEVEVVRARPVVEVVAARPIVEVVRPRPVVEVVGSRIAFGPGYYGPRWGGAFNGGGAVLRGGEPCHGGGGRR